MYINVLRQLKKYGVDIKVWSADKLPKKDLVGGIRPPAELSEDIAESRHEPVLPFSSTASQIAQLLGGGAQLQGDLLWLSSGKYPINSIVEVPTQGGCFRVVNFSNYQDYSNLIVYELKGDDQHKHGEPIAGAERSVPDSVHLGSGSETGLRL